MVTRAPAFTGFLEGEHGHPRACGRLRNARERRRSQVARNLTNRVDLHRRRDSAASGTSPVVLTATGSHRSRPFRRLHHFLALIHGIDWPARDVPSTFADGSTERIA
jgi:hypothetical protein